MKIGKQSILLTATLTALVCLSLVISACGNRSRVTASPASTPTQLTANESVPFPAHPLPENLRFTHYTIDQGLSMSTVNDILQDRIGYIWIATEDGLNRFDGYTYQVFRHNPENPNTPSTNHITELFEDQSGVLWLGTISGGLNRIDPFTDEYSIYLPEPENPNSLLGDMVTSIYQDESGILWIGTDEGLNRFDHQNGNWEHFIHQADDPSSLSTQAVTDLYEDSTGQLWVGTPNGLNAFNRQTKQFTRYLHDDLNPKSLTGNSVGAIYEDSRGQLWVGTEGGLNRFDAQAGEFDLFLSDPQQAGNLSSQVVTSLTEDDWGNLWVGTNQGLNRYDAEKGKFIRYLHQPGNPDSLGNDNITCLSKDHSGGVWICTAYAGAERFDRMSAQFTHLQPEPSTPASVSENSTWSIWGENSGVLWLGTNGGGLKGYDRKSGEWVYYRNQDDNPDSLSNDVVMSIYQDQAGSLWVGTWGGGLNRMDADSGVFSHYQHDPQEPSSLSSDAAFVVYEDQQGRLWVGTDDGLNLFDRKSETFTRFQHDPDDPTSLSGKSVVAIYQDRMGILWIGTLTGLNRFNPQTGSFTRYQHDAQDELSLSHDSVFALHEDANGSLWVGTYGGGLNKLDRRSGTFSHYSVIDGLTNDSVYGLLEDKQGNLWISTNDGVSRFDPRSETFHNFSVADGLQAKEFNYNAYFQNADGEMFFGGVNGVNIFRPEQIMDNPYAPQVVLQSISQGGEAVDLGQVYELADEIILRWPNNYFDFEFATLSYFQSEQNQHAYFLENFDNEWNDIGDRRFGRYTNLPGGKYTLRMNGANNDGLWNENGAAIQVTVVPPLWENPWVLGIAGLLVLGGAFGYYRLRVRGLETQARELESQVVERTAEINRGRRQIEALYRADEELYRYLRLDQVLQALIDTAVQILQADKGAMLCWDEQEENLVIRAAHNFKPETMIRARIPRGSGIAGQVAETGKSIAVEDTADNPLVTHEIIDAESIQAFIQEPIKIGDEIFGVFSVDYLQPRTFSDDEKRLLTSLAQRAALAIQNAQLYEQARELAATQERNRLARELHDAVTQTLFSASLLAEALPTIWERDPEEGREQLDKMRQMSRGALAEMRALLLELRPAALVDTSLDDLLRQLGEAVMGREGFPVQITVDKPCSLPPEVHIALYRIAQEALNNVVKHARAEQVQILLRCTYHADEQLESIELSIQDDGRGFSPAEASSERLGLGIMHERASAIGATLTIKSQPGQGTLVTVSWSPDR